MIKRYIHGWRIFFILYLGQRRKKHGKGKRDFLSAVYFAACGQYLVDHQYRCPGKPPWHGRLARFIKLAWE